MEWLVHSFKQSIDEEFPTLPGREHTFIAGSSMGGLMSLYALLEYNQIFSRAAALSPSLWVAPQRLARLVRGAQVEPDSVLYMDYGSREMGSRELMREQFSRVTEQLLSRGVKLTCRIVPDGDHCEASWERQIPFFLPTLLYGLEF